MQQPLRQSILPQSSEDENSTLDLEDILTGGVENEKSSIHTGTDGTKDTSFANDMAAAGTKDTSFTSVDSGTKSASSSRGTKGSGCDHKCKRRSSSTGPRPKKRRVLAARNQKKTANKIRSKAVVQSHRTTHSRQPLLQYSLDDLLSNNKKRGAKPNTLKEEDPILKAFQENQPEELPELLKS